MKDINFLDTMQGVKGEKKEQKKSVPAAQIIILVIFLTIGISVLFIPQVMITSLEKQISAVEQSMYDTKYAELRNVKALLTNITQVVDEKKAVIRDIDEKNYSASQILILVEQALPADCYISAFNFSDGSIQLSGVAESSLIYAEFLSHLDRLDQMGRKTGTLTIEKSNVPVDFTLQYSVQKKQEVSQ